jgi:hypothetical protein
MFSETLLCEKAEPPPECFDQPGSRAFVWRSSVWSLRSVGALAKVNTLADHPERITAIQTLSKIGKVLYKSYQSDRGHGALRPWSPRGAFVGGTEQIMVVTSDASVFTSKDRELLRMEFMDRFGSAVSIHDGFWIKRWSTGPRKGQPKISPALAALIERDLLRIVDAESGMPRACFTDAGLRALIALAEDRRAFQPPQRYAHLLAEIAALRQVRSDA